MPVELSPSVMFQDLSERAILFDVDRNVYFGLEGVGAQFWRLLAEGLTPDAVIAPLLEMFAVDEATLRTDLEALMAELQDAGLIQVVAGSPGPCGASGPTGAGG